MRVRTEVTISVAHQLPNYKGNCHNLHGHSVKVEIIAVGPVNKKTGMVVDFKELKEIVNKFDHSFLNDALENPTAENITTYLLKQFKKKYPKLHFTVRVWESGTSYAEDKVW